MGSDEAAYINTRRTTIIPGAIKAYLGTSAGAVYNGSLSSIAALDMPVISVAISGTCSVIGPSPRFSADPLACSGGGYRAGLYGAATLAAMDGRNNTVGLGGILQSASYVSALSGGSWLLSSYIFNDMPSSPYEMVLGTNGTSNWNINNDIFNPSTNTTLETAFVTDIIAQMTLKVSSAHHITADLAADNLLFSPE